MTGGEGHSTEPEVQLSSAPPEGLAQRADASPPVALAAGIGFSAARIMRNTLARLATAVVGQGSKGIIAILVARELGVAAFGTFSVVWTVSSIAAYYGALGIDNLIIRELSRRVPLIDVRRAVPFVSSLGVVTAVVLVGGAFVTTTGDFTAMAFGAAAPYVAFTAPLLVLTATFNARERMELESLVETIEGAVALVAAIVALAMGGGIIAVLAALSVGRGIGLVCATITHLRLPQLPTTPGAVNWSQAIRASLPMGGVRLFTAAYQRADIVILGFVVSSTQVGLYSAAAIAVLLVVDGLSEVGRAAYPALSRARGITDPELRRAFAVIWKVELYLALAAAAGLIALATPLSRDIFGEEFVAAGPLLAVMSASLVLRVLGNLGGISLYAVDRQAHRLRAIAVATVAKLVVVVATVPFFGLWGAAGSAVVADVVYIGIMLWLVRSYRPSLTLDALPALATATAVGMAAWMVPGPTALRIAAGVVVFAGLIGLVAGRNLVSMFTGGSGEHTLPQAVQAGPIRVRFEGNPELSRSVIARSLALLPVWDAEQAATTTELTIEFRDGVDPQGVRLHGHPLFRDDGCLWAVDHTGRAAHLPLADLSATPIVIDPSLEVDVFQTWVQLPLLKLLLHREGWCLARLTVVDVHGCRVALVARSTVGKTRVELALLERGADFVGDDWVALGPKGVAPVCSLVVVRDQARAALQRWGIADRVRRGAIALLRFAAKRLAGWRKMSLSVHAVQSLLWRWGTDVVDVRSLLPNVTIAACVAPIDLVVVLDGDGRHGSTADAAQLAEVVASRAIIDLPSAGALEAIFRAGNPGNRSVAMPTIDEDAALIAEAFRAAAVDVVAIDSTAEAVDRVARHIEQWCERCALDRADH